MKLKDARERPIDIKINKKGIKMKRKIFSILFTLVLVLSFSLVTAVPAGASPDPTTLEVVPRTLPEITLDGVIGVEEWAGATTFDLDSAYTAYVMTDDYFIYVAFDYPVTTGSDFASFNTYKEGTFDPETINAPCVSEWGPVWDKIEDIDPADGVPETWSREDPSTRYDYAVDTATEMKVSLAELGLEPGDAIKTIFVLNHHVTGAHVYPDGAASFDLSTYEDGTLPTYATIQGAIDYADTGDTITVAAGEYDENVVILADKDGLQLVGAGSGVTSIATASGSPLMLKGNSPGKPLDGVTIKGFTLKTADTNYKLITQSETSTPYSYDTTNLILEDIVVDGGQRGICLNQVEKVTLIDVHISNITGEAGDGALELTAVSDLTFTGGSIVGNAIGVRLQVYEPYGPNGSIQIDSSSLVGNTVAIENQDILIIDAPNNWWGATNGPYHPTLNPNGLGNAVSDFVDFDPYLDSPIEAGTGAVSMTAESEEAFIGISVSPTFINFGAITSGAVVVGDALTVKNTGNVRIMVDAEITADTVFGKDQSGNDLYFYTAALRLNGGPSDKMQPPPPDPTSFGSWTLIRAEGGPLGDQPMWVNESRSLTTGLECPSPIYAATTYTGTVVFWAEQP